MSLRPRVRRVRSLYAAALRPRHDHVGSLVRRRVEARTSRTIQSIIMASSFRQTGRKIVAYVSCIHTGSAVTLLTMQKN